jgi:dipeptidyl aminopeptidase/acylaminoacyl peptidase
MMRTHTVRWRFALVPLALLAVTLYAQEDVLTPERILSIRTITDAQLSPDGSTIVFQVNRPRTEREKPGAAIPELWIVPSAGGEPRRFTASPAGDHSPRWSPDGGTIAFVSRREDQNSSQLYLIPSAGGEARQLTRAEGNVGMFRWSPDGKRIAFLMRDPRTAAEREAEQRGEDWTIADQNYKHTRLYVVDVATGVTVRIYEDDLTVYEFDWSPDGHRFVIVAAQTPTVDDSYMRKRLYTVPASGGSPALLTKTEGKLGNAAWSPDGRWIAWNGAVAENDPYQGSVFVVESAGGTPRNLTRGYQGTASWVGWRPGRGAELIARGIERQSTFVSSLALSDGKQTPLLKGDAMVSSEPSFSSDGSAFAIVANTPTHPNEVFLVSAAEGAARRLTVFNPQLQGVRLGEQRVVRWKSTDGWDIEGVVVLPVGYEKGRRYPTVLQPHGGPEAADLNGWMASYGRWGQMLAGMGYVTFYPNYRGSIGRGPEFAMADHRDLMGREFDDMLSGLDELIAQGITDGSRLGVGGGSYGGYAAGWAATYASERFKAAVVWMGISDWISMTGTSDIFYENSTVHWDLMLYEGENSRLFWQRSPVAQIQRAKTPTLIVHGAADPRVPIGQSQELYTALKWKGVPVEFVTYPRAGHGLSERAHQLDFMKRVAGWFENYLKP